MRLKPTGEQALRYLEGALDETGQRYFILEPLPFHKLDEQRLPPPSDTQP